MNDMVLGFNGERLDPVTGTTHLGNGYRAYSPALMRFICPDSWSPFGEGGLNPYAYCAGDPINRADPSGHMSTGQWVGMVFGAVAGLALGILTEGAAIPAVMTLMATVAGDAAIGAGAELVTEAVDKQRVNWGRVGIAAGISAAATLAGYGVGLASRLRGIAPRPFGGMMMEIPGVAKRQTAVLSTVSGQDMSIALRKNFPGTAVRNVQNLNTMGLIESRFNTALYRYDRLPPEIILKSGFPNSANFSSLPRMLPLGRRYGGALIVAENLRGADVFYKAIRKETAEQNFYLYKINARNAAGVSLHENFFYNKEGLFNDFFGFGHTNFSWHEFSAMTNNANNMFEAHIRKADIQLSDIEYMGFRV